MTLVRPELLGISAVAALLAALAIVAGWWRLRRLERLLGDAASWRLLPARALRFPTARLSIAVAVAASLGLAAAEPEQPTEEPPPAATPLDLAVAVDISLSMDAADAAPSRILRAQEVVSELAGAFPGARLVLVVFADWPYTLVPPTDDPGVVRWFAESLQADLVIDRDQGTALAAAIEHASEALAARPRSPNEGARRVVLLVSDGGAQEESGTVLEAARAAAEDGIEVWTAGLGTTRGIQLETETGPVLDATGTPVLTRLDERLLVDVAAAGGGAYEDVGGERGLRALLARLQDANTSVASAGREPPDVTLLLALFALALILAEGALDGRRSVRHAARTGEAW